MATVGARAMGGFLGLLMLGVAAGGAALPVPELPDVLDGLEFVTSVAHGGGGGLWIHEGFAYSSGLNAGFFVTDVRDPEHPVKLGSIGGMFMRDADVIDYGARVVAVAASEGPGMRFIDVTNPASPTLLSTLDPGNTHNLAAVPGTTLVYNSRGGGSSGPLRIDIVDGANPSAPVLVKTWVSPAQVNGQTITSSSCHDIHVSVDVDRAYCAGGGATIILDIADPLNPVALGQIRNKDINYHHWAVPSADHQLLILGDEDFSPDDQPCLGVPAPIGTPTAAEGALWFYNIADPKNPVMLSWASPPENLQGGSCTAHFGELIPGKAQLVAGFYRGGIILVDFSLPALPRVVAQYQDNVNAWDVRYWDGHVFTGDINRGMDVLQLT